MKKIISTYAVAHQSAATVVRPHTANVFGMRHRTIVPDRPQEHVTVTIDDSASTALLAGPRGSGSGLGSSSSLTAMSDLPTEIAPMNEFTKRALGFGILALLVASWAGVVLVEWVVVASGAVTTR